MTALYDYGDNDDGLVDHITYGNGASVWYEYDDARRLEKIIHRDGQDPAPTEFLILEYEYTDRDEVAQISEYHGSLDPDVVDFSYDNRGRLTWEKRTEGPLPTDVYDITYEYDNGGNRTAKEDAVSNTRVEYHYDLEDPSEYDSKNNQLMYYQEFDTSGPGDPVLVSTTWYYYTFMGNVERVVTSAKDSDVCESTWFRYAENDQTATMIIGETWNWNGVDPPDPQSYDITYGREFRYDQARARYLTHVLDPDDLEDGNLTTVSKVWSDYDGDVIYGDYTVDGGTATNIRSYEPGMGKVEPWTSVGAASTSCYHTDMLGTTRYMTTPDDGQGGGGGRATGGLATGGVTYTAFGERICTLDDSCGPTDPDPRYGYAGAHGYRAQDTAEDPGSDPVPFLHVGHRYYDPAIGRFLQRDPIGIWGGLNVYTYAQNAPTNRVDADGQGWFAAIVVIIIVVAIVNEIIDVVKAALQAQGVSNLGPDRSAQNQMDVDQFIDAVGPQRAADFQNSLEGIQGIIETVPGTTITGDAQPPTDAGGAGLWIATECAGRLQYQGN